MRHCIDTVKVVDLTDLYLTREEHSRAMWSMRKRINGCNGMIFAGAFMIGWLIGAMAEQKKRMDELEARLNKKDETAG